MIQGMEARRELEEIPHDKRFGNELCRATGFEECHGNPRNLSDWWNEYEDRDGNKHYGR